MKARLSLMLMVFAVALVLGGFVQVPPSSAAPWHHSYEGQVVSYDHAGNLVVNGKEGERAFNVSKATVKGVIEPNERVIVKYRRDDDRIIASSVKVIEPKTSKHHGKAERSYGG